MTDDVQSPDRTERRFHGLILPPLSGVDVMVLMFFLAATVMAFKGDLASSTKLLFTCALAVVLHTVLYVFQHWSEVRFDAE